MGLPSDRPGADGDGGLIVVGVVVTNPGQCAFCRVDGGWFTFSVSPENRSS